MSVASASSIYPTPKRVKNQLVFRQMTVQQKTLVADTFWRIVFTGEQLKGFHSPSFDDHSKLFFPDASGVLNLPVATEEGISWPDGKRPAARDYTPLAFDGENSLTIDFFLHNGGIASEWAKHAMPGDALAVGGPRGSLLIPTDYPFQLYVCDETGLPAMKRRLAELQPVAAGKTIRVLAQVDEALGRDYLGEVPGVEISWLPSAELLNRALHNLTLPNDGYFFWLTGEGAQTKQRADFLIQQRQVSEECIRAVAYWHQKPALP